MNPKLGTLKFANTLETRRTKNTSQLFFVDILAVWPRFKSRKEDVHWAAQLKARIKLRAFSQFS
jgi:hypothetical protein